MPLDPSQLMAGTQQMANLANPTAMQPPGGGALANPMAYGAMAQANIPGIGPIANAGAAVGMSQQYEQLQQQQAIQQQMQQLQLEQAQKEEASTGDLKRKVAQSGLQNMLANMPGIQDLIKAQTAAGITDAQHQQFQQSMTDMQEKASLLNSLARTTVTPSNQQAIQDQYKQITGVDVSDKSGPELQTLLDNEGVAAPAYAMTAQKAADLAVQERLVRAKEGQSPTADGGWTPPTTTVNASIQAKTALGEQGVQTRGQDIQAQTEMAKAQLQPGAALQALETKYNGPNHGADMTNGELQQLAAGLYQRGKMNMKPNDPSQMQELQIQQTSPGQIVPKYAGPDGKPMLKQDAQANWDTRNIGQNYASVNKLLAQRMGAAKTYTPAQQSYINKVKAMPGFNGMSDDDIAAGATKQGKFPQ